MKTRFKFNQSLALCVGLFAWTGWAIHPANAAITIVQPAGANYVATVPLTGLPAGATGSVTLNPAKPLAVLAPPGAGSVFMTTFTADVGQYPGWTAVAGGALAGSLTINSYKARDYGTPRGGADMNATYAPAVAEAGMSFAWIQIYTDNAGAGGAQRRHIDPFPNDGTDAGPFYYADTDPGGIVNLVFDDHPSDPVSTLPFNRTVQFETYLSTFNKDTKVATIYDGYSWGYTIAATPEPGTLTCLLASALTLCVRRRSPSASTIS